MARGREQVHTVHWCRWLRRPLCVLIVVWRLRVPEPNFGIMTIGSSDVSEKRAWCTMIYVETPFRVIRNT
jgi:hypothetical protein